MCSGPGDITCGYYPVARGVDANIRSLLVTAWQYDGPWTWNVNCSLVGGLFQPDSHNMLTTALGVPGATVAGVLHNATDTLPSSTDGG